MRKKKRLTCRGTRRRSSCGEGVEVKIAINWRRNESMIDSRRSQKEWKTWSRLLRVYLYVRSSQVRHSNRTSATALSYLPYLKMTEKALILIRLPMSASLPLPLVQQVPKRLYQATDWRDRGQSSPLDSRHTPDSLDYHYYHLLLLLLLSFVLSIPISISSISSSSSSSSVVAVAGLEERKGREKKGEPFCQRLTFFLPFTFFQTVWVCWIG